MRHLFFESPPQDANTLERERVRLQREHTAIKNLDSFRGGPIPTLGWF